MKRAILLACGLCLLAAGAWAHKRPFPGEFFPSEHSSCVHPKIAKPELIETDMSPIGIFAFTTLNAVFNLTVVPTVLTTECLEAAITGLERADDLVAASYERLEEESAQGGGPYLDSLAELLGCPAALDRPFQHLNQREFAELFTGSLRARAAYLPKLVQRMRADARLGAACREVAGPA